MLGSTGKWNDLQLSGGSYAHIAVVELPGGGTKNPCPADLDGDGVVSASDLSALLGAWGTIDGDVDGDGTTNAADLSAVLGAWGACP